MRGAGADGRADGLRDADVLLYEGRPLPHGLFVGGVWLEYLSGEYIALVEVTMLFLTCLNHGVDLMWALYAPYR